MDFEAFAGWAKLRVRPTAARWVAPKELAGKIARSARETAKLYKD